MHNALPRASLATSLALASITFAHHANAQNEPRYLAAVRAELTAMGLTPQCAPTSSEVGTCRVRATVATAGAMPGGAPSSGREFALTLEYSDASDTVYVYADHYANVSATSPSAPAIFRRLAEMNWEMLLGKLEWSAATGEVRIGAVLNTDSNFDRRAFRGLVRSVVRLADRYAPELSQLTGAPIGGAPVPQNQPATAGTRPAPSPTPGAAPSAPQGPSGASLTPLPH